MGRLCIIFNAFDKNNYFKKCSALEMEGYFWPRLKLLVKIKH